MSEHRVCLYKVNRELRQYRFYSLSVHPNLFGTWSLVREWGRIGCAGRERIGLDRRIGHLIRLTPR